MDHNTTPTQTPSASASVSPTATANTPHIETVHQPDQISHIDESNVSHFEFDFSPVADVSLPNWVTPKERPETPEEPPRKIDDFQYWYRDSPPRTAPRLSNNLDAQTEQQSPSRNGSKSWINRRLGGFSQYGNVFQKSHWSGYLSNLLQPISKVTSKRVLTKSQDSSTMGSKSKSHRHIRGRWSSGSEPGLLATNNRSSPRELSDFVSTSLGITYGFNASFELPTECPRLQDLSGYLDDTDNQHGDSRTSKEGKSVSL